MKRPLSVMSALLAAVIAWSCGVKGPPEPPPLPAPAEVGRFRARVREQCVELAWRAPEVSPPDYTEAVLYEVQRAPALADQPPAFRVIDRVRDTSYLDCSLGPDARALYRVRGISEQKRPGETSSPLMVIMAPAPTAPRNPLTSPGDGFVEITWTMPADMPADAGFDVYRSQDPMRFPWRPVNMEPVGEAGFTDGPLENGVRYYYEIRPVRTVEGAPPVEGPAAPLVSATPADRAPPEPPQGFTAIWTPEGVRLHWLRNQEPDLKGYVVYRRQRGVGAFKELFVDPIQDTVWLDKSARRGVEYEYAVSAVDNAYPPNPSPFSEFQVVYAEPR